MTTEPLPPTTPEPVPDNDFQRASQERRLSLWQEFRLFLAEEGKWWFIPIWLALGMIALFIAAAMTGAAPFIYTLG